MICTKAGILLASLIFLMGLQSISIAQNAETTATEALTTGTVIREDATTVTSEVATSTVATPPSHPQNEATSVSLSSVIVYQIKKPGTGPEAPTTGTRLIHYTLRLAGQDKIMESSRDADMPVPFSFVSGEGQAIKGMDIGTNGMRVGEIRDIYVPAEMGYADEAHGHIPSGSNLLFEVELVGIK